MMDSYLSTKFGVNSMTRSQKRHETGKRQMTDAHVTVLPPLTELNMNMTMQHHVLLLYKALNVIE